VTGGQADREPYEIGAAVGTRVIGIDLGERRIGVSVSDSRRVLASPHSVIARSGDQGADHRAIAALVSEFDAGLVVIGLPLSLSGKLGPAAQAAVVETEALESVLSVPVVLHDERLTTVEADRLLRLRSDSARASGGERGSLQPRRRRRPRSAAASSTRLGIDALAATVLLQSWLDEKRAES
jgi:putative Holliday junction resolvase